MVNGELPSKKEHQQPNNSETQSPSVTQNLVPPNYESLDILLQTDLTMNLNLLAWNLNQSVVNQGTFCRIFCHLPKMVYSNHLQNTPFVCFEWLPRSGGSIPILENVVSSGYFSFWFGDLKVVALWFFSPEASETKPGTTYYFPEPFFFKLPTM